MIGSPASEASREDGENQHQVTASSFYIGKHEITQKEFEEIMGANPSHIKGENLPVEKVSWEDAIEYCNKRSEKEKLTPAYTRSGEWWHGTPRQTATACRPRQKGNTPTAPEPICRSAPAATSPPTR